MKKNFFIASVLCVVACSCSETSECPFKYLPYSTRTEIKSAEGIKFATEFNLDLSLLKRNLEGRLTPKVVFHAQKTVEKYKDELLCPDSTFVKFFNARVNNLCNRWQLYINDGKSASSREKVEEAIDELDAFVKDVYEENRRPEYTLVMNLNEHIYRLQEAVVRALSAEQNPINRITLETQAKKLEYLSAVAREIDTEFPRNEDFIKSKEIDNHIKNIYEDFQKISEQPVIW